jgi:ribosomal-protein-alanine N-acetyltransferase
MHRATRLVALDDAAALAAVIAESRDFLAPYEPHRDAGYATEEGQRALLGDALRQHGQGRTVPHVVLDEAGEVVGRITLGDIVRGPFQSCHLGYWVAERAGGRGLGTAAVREVLRVAFEETGLHRVQAATLVDNLRSQRVLAKCGFTPIGVAPRYLRIAGRWQDHLLFQVLSPLED